MDWFTIGGTWSPCDPSEERMATEHRKISKLYIYIYIATDLQKKLYIYIYIATCTVLNFHSTEKGKGKKIIIIRSRKKKHIGSQILCEPQRLSFTGIPE